MAAIFGIPVGFVNVLESKAMLLDSGIPFACVEGNRGGSALAVAALHAVLEVQD